MCKMCCVWGVLSEEAEYHIEGKEVNVLMFVLNAYEENKYVI